MHPSTQGFPSPSAYLQVMSNTKSEKSWVVVFTRLLKASETLKVYVPHAIREKFLVVAQDRMET